METLKLESPEAVNWEYDSETDVLYISFGKPQAALTMDLGGGVLARYLEESGTLVGFTVMGVGQVLKGKH